MKYWLFQNNQVNGPYEPEEISNAAGYGAESLVCAEGHKGTKMGDWQRASAVPELASSLSKIPQLTPSIKISPPANSGTIKLPPDPTVQDLAALGGLQEKISLLERAITNLQDNLQKKDGEITSLHNEFQDKSRQSQKAQEELSQKIKELEEKERQVKTELAAKIQELEQKGITTDEKLQEISALKDRLEAPQTAPPPPAPLEEPQPPQQDPLSAPTPEQIFAPPAEAPFAAAPEPLFGTPIEPPPVSPFETVSPLESVSMPAQEPPAAAPAPITAPAPAAEFPLSAQETLLAETSPKVNKPSMTPPAQPLAASKGKPKSESKKFLFIFLGLTVTVAVSAYMMGLLPIGPLPRGKIADSSKIPGALTPLTPPASPANPPQPSGAPAAPAAQRPEDHEEDLKQSAIEQVKKHASAEKMKTIAEVLEKDLSQADGINPWIGDKVKENVYKVNFYSPNPDGQSQPFEFEADLADKKVTPINEAARIVMEGKKAPAGKARKPARLKPQLQKVKQVKTAPAAKKKTKIRPKKKVPAAAVLSTPKGKAVDEMLLPGFKREEPPAQTPNPSEVKSAEAKPEETPAPKPKKAADAELLDNLLTP